MQQTAAEAVGAGHGEVPCQVQPGRTDAGGVERCEKIAEGVGPLRGFGRSVEHRLERRCALNGPTVGVHQVAQGDDEVVALGKRLRWVHDQHLVVDRPGGVEFGPIGNPCAGVGVEDHDRCVVVQRGGDVGAGGDAGALDIEHRHERQDRRPRGEAVCPVLIGEVDGHAVDVLRRSAVEDVQPAAGGRGVVGAGECIVRPGQQARPLVEWVAEQRFEHCSVAGGECVGGGDTRIAAIRIRSAATDGEGGDREEGDPTAGDANGMRHPLRVPQDPHPMGSQPLRSYTCSLPESPSNRAW
ncbi:unannotated protein [freshwater metagenome]|uniref:Unannotated protein n=1 Tax=freshwater metagenome TaxID=449393 RepID=A0A6J7C9J9_9ZZZZ